MQSVSIINKGYDNAMEFVSLHTGYPIEEVSNVVDTWWHIHQIPFQFSRAQLYIGLERLGIVCIALLS